MTTPLLYDDTTPEQKPTAPLLLAELYCNTMRDVRWTFLVRIWAILGWAILGCLWAILGWANLGRRYLGHSGQHLKSLISIAE